MGAVRRFSTRAVLFPVLTVGLVALGGADGVAAQVRRVGRPGIPATRLLTVKEVQDDLGLTPEQVRQARAAAEKDRDAESQVEAAPPAERDRRWKELLAGSEKAAAAILRPAQLPRFRQIRLQQAGAVALTDPKLADELNLTADQRKAVNAVAEDLGAKFRAAVADPAPTNREVAAKISELRREADAAVRKHLTADQKKKWEEMLGKPFRWPAP